MHVISCQKIIMFRYLSSLKDKNTCRHNKDVTCPSLNIYYKNNYVTKNNMLLCLNRNNISICPINITFLS